MKVRLKWVSLRGESGQAAPMSARHRSQLRLAAHIEAANLTGQPAKSPVFRLSQQRSLRSPIYDHRQRAVSIVEHRLKAAGLPETTFSCILSGPPTPPTCLSTTCRAERFQHLLGHSDARTTNLYNLASKEVLPSFFDRISFYS